MCVRVGTAAELGVECGLVPGVRVELSQQALRNAVWMHRHVLARVHQARHDQAEINGLGILAAALADVEVGIAPVLAAGG